jgi:ribose transport system substrate-binding protein
MNEEPSKKILAPGRRGFVLSAGATILSASLAACTLGGKTDQAATPTSGGSPSTGTGGSFSGSSSFENLALSAEAKKKPLKIAFIVQQLSAQSGQHSVAAFEKYVKDEALPWDVRVQDAKGDPGTLSAMMTDAATARVDGIVVAYGTLTAAQTALKAVEASGVPLITIDSGYFSPAVCDITSNNFAIGAEMSQYMVSRLMSTTTRPANIAVIYANFHHGTRRRGKVLDAVLKENEWINVLDSSIIEYSGFYETTLRTVQDWIARHGDKIDAIWCPWDEPAEAAAEAILRAGMNVNNTFVIGADGNSTAIQKMRAENFPHVFTASQCFELWSPLAALIIGQIAAEGKDPRQVVPLAQISTPSPSLVAGLNLPEQSDAYPWTAASIDYQIRDSAMKAAG